MTELAQHYLDEARRQFRGYKRLGEGALAQLKDQEFVVTLDPESNSAAIIVKHMAGNMRSRFTDFLTSDGEKPDRHRDQEFELSSETARADVMDWWEAGWSCLLSRRPDCISCQAPPLDGLEVAQYSARSVGRGQPQAGGAETGNASCRGESILAALPGC